MTDFFRINLPYGISRNSKDEWFAFNREYMPLGWNSTANQKSIFIEDVYSEFPIYTKYKGLTDEFLTTLVEPDSIRRDEDGKINRVFFYDDRTNPQSHPKQWSRYNIIIQRLSRLEVKHQTINS